MGCFLTMLPRRRIQERCHFKCSLCFRHAHTCFHLQVWPSVSSSMWSNCPPSQLPSTWPSIPLHTLDMEYTHIEAHLAQNPGPLQQADPLAGCRVDAAVLLGRACVPGNPWAESPIPLCLVLQVERCHGCSMCRFVSYRMSAIGADAPKRLHAPFWAQCRWYRRASRHSNGTKLS